MAEPSDFDIDRLSVFTGPDNKKTIVYNNDSRIFIKSAVFHGKVVLNKDPNPRMVIKISDTMRAVREGIQIKMGMRTTFYAKDDATMVGCYIDTVINANGQKCVNCVEDGDIVLMPVDNLANRICSFYAVLQSRGLKVSAKTGFLSWSLSVAELKISGKPEDIEITEFAPGPELPHIRFCTVKNVD